MKIAIIGAGTIGSSLAKSLIKSTEGNEILATRRNLEKISDLNEIGINLINNNQEAAEWSEVVVIATKPLDLKKIVKEIRENIKNKVVISLAAAVSLDILKSLAPEARFIRAMPNIAVMVQESFTVYSSDTDITSNDKKIIDMIFGAMGKYYEIEEKHMDGITGLSGSGPAYIFTIIESLIYAGLRVGIPRDLAVIAASQTVLGAAKMALESHKPVSELKDMVVTPGGVTLEGLHELEDGRLRTTINRAVQAATKRSKEISNEIKSQKNL